MRAVELEYIRCRHLCNVNIMVAATTIITSIWLNMEDREDPRDPAALVEKEEL
jgi:hypothetical protein